MRKAGKKPLKNPVAVISADKEILELIREDRRLQLVGFFDPNPNAKGLNCAHLGADQDFAKAVKKYPRLKVALALDPPGLKKKALTMFSGQAFTGVLSKHAIISPSAHVGDCCIVQMGARILTEAHIGDFCKINVNAVIHHDCRVGNFCTLAPGCLLLGAVTVEDECYIGAGSVILPKLHIGKGAVIGAGAVVTKDVPPGETWAGVPAKRLS